MVMVLEVCAIASRPNRGRAETRRGRAVAGRSGFATLPGRSPTARIKVWDALSPRVNPVYPGAREYVVNRVLDQVYYRGPGLVPTHLGIADSHDAAVWVSENIRGGTLTWVAPGRAFWWRDIATSPGLPGSETMDALFVGSALLQLNTAIIRTRGFLREELARRFPWLRAPGED